MTDNRPPWMGHADQLQAERDELFSKFSKELMKNDRLHNVNVKLYNTLGAVDAWFEDYADKLRQMGLSEEVYALSVLLDMNHEETAE